MRAARVLVKLSFIDGFLDRNNNRPDFPFLHNFRSGKAVWQLAVLLGFVGLCADAGDKIGGNCNARQILCQVKGRCSFLRQCHCWEQSYEHDKAE